MNINNKILGVVLSAAAFVSTFNVLPSSAASAETGEMRNITTMELVHDMGLGINLGNTMESCGDWIDKYGDGSVRSYETAWGSPVITEAMIDGYANEGFGTLRIPVAWSNLMGENYTISADYLKRVRQLVDWAIEDDMYVILNIHYDGGWFSGFSTDKSNCMTKYKRIWEQLTEEFADYSDFLVFESLNEEGVWNDLPQADAYAMLNEINQTFVDIVRSSGGNNGERHLLIAGYATDFDKTCSSLFKMPDDPMSRCAVSVHYYTPSTFCILEEDASWGKNRTTWGTANDIKQLNYYMSKMKTNFVDKGIPVIIGEYGCPKKNKEADSVRLFLTTAAKTAYDMGMCPVLWDITGLHYDRTTCKMTDTKLKQAFWSILGKTPEYALGDVDMDGAVNSSDASTVLSTYALTSTGAASPLSPSQITLADVNSDNAVDSSDASAILAFYAYTSTGGTIDNISDYLG